MTVTRQGCPATDSSDCTSHCPCSRVMILGTSGSMCSARFCQRPAAGVRMESSSPLGSTNTLDWSTRQFRFLQPWVFPVFTPKEWADLELLASSYLNNLIHMVNQIVQQRALKFPLVVQCSMGCWLGPNGTASSFYDAGFGDMLLHVLNVTFVKTLHKLVQSGKEALERQVKPVAVVFARPSGPGSLLLVCRVTGFYPPARWGNYEDVDASQPRDSILYQPQIFQLTQTSVFPDASSTDIAAMAEGDMEKIEPYYKTYMRNFIQYVRKMGRQAGLAYPLVVQIQAGCKLYLNDTVRGFLSAAENGTNLIAYELRSALAVATGDGRSYACRVQHSSLGDRSLLVPWESSKAGQKAAGSIAVLVIVAAAIAGAFWWRRRRKEVNRALLETTAFPSLATSPHGLARSPHIPDLRVSKPHRVGHLDPGGTERYRLCCSAKTYLGDHLPPAMGLLSPAGGPVGEPA
nr:PREDICTED: uncharacterized protein LOC104139337 [Struthio camelus australis]